MKRLVFFVPLFLLLTNFTIIVENLDFSNTGKNKQQKVNSLLDMFTSDGDFILGTELAKLVKDRNGDKATIHSFMYHEVEMITYYDHKFWFKMRDGKSQYLTVFPNIKGMKVMFPFLIKHNACIEVIRTEEETTFVITGIKLWGFDLEKIVINDNIMTVYKYGTMIYQRS